MWKDRGRLAQLTTTSYLILGMLTSRDWSAYELAEQIAKGVTDVWPRASRQLYNAPKQLVDLGLLTAVQQHRGRRVRTVYSITPAGREELRRWLESDAKPPSLEFEAMIHVVLADQGSLEDLKRTLQHVIEQATEARQAFERRDEHIRATDGGSFPERQHLFKLSSAFMIGHFTHLAEWATWALAEVETWPDTARGS